MEPTSPPSRDFLESVAAFERHIFSSAKVRRLSAAIDGGGPPPDLDPPLAAVERRGKQGPGFDLPTRRFTVDLPGGGSVVLVSSDPGTVLTDAHALETVGGNRPRLSPAADSRRGRRADRRLPEEGLLSRLVPRAVREGPPAAVPISGPSRARWRASCPNPP